MYNKTASDINKIGIDHYVGCLLGGAIGDSLGAPIEFMTIDEIRRKYGQKGVQEYIEFRDRKGRFTDDTQMTLFTADGVIRAIQRSRVKGIWGAIIDTTYYSYLRWLYTQGDNLDFEPIQRDKDWILKGWLVQQKGLFQHRFPGNTCLSVLKSGKHGTIQKPINDSKGSGGIMRMVPVGLVFYNDSEFAFKTGCDLAAITHGHPNGYLSAGCFVSIISCLAQKKSLIDSIYETIEILKQWKNHQECLEAIEKAINLSKESEPTPETIAQLGKGWIAEEALSISLYCVLSYPTDFKKGVLASINHSGDSDTTGAITGNLLGLIVGENNIPKAWVKNLELANVVKRIGKDLYNVYDSKASAFGPDPEWYRRYPA